MEKRILIMPIVLMLMLGINSTALGQQVNQVDAAVYFRIGESHIDPKFEDNGTRLEQFIATIQEYSGHSTMGRPGTN